MEETSMSMEEVFEAIKFERERQDLKWGGKEHDETHSLNEWLVFINDYVKMAKRQASNRESELAKANLVKIAALCVAALESLS